MLTYLAKMLSKFSTKVKILFLSQASEVKAKEEVEKQREEAEVKMSVQVAALNENVATLKREWQSSQRRVGELEKQTDELRGEIAVLEATVQNNQDERRALLERFDWSKYFLGLNKQRDKEMVTINFIIFQVCPGWGWDWKASG